MPSGHVLFQSADGGSVDQPRSQPVDAFQMAKPMRRSSHRQSAQICTL